MEKDIKCSMKWNRISLSSQKKEYSADSVSRPASEYLIARRECREEEQKDMLYRILGPVFFGEKAARTDDELIQLFREKYGIDVKTDFFEGDEHYEEYLEAKSAIAEGYSIYGGSIMFEDGILAELAERVWESMEQHKKNGFRRINTMLEE